MSLFALYVTLGFKEEDDSTPNREMYFLIIRNGDSPIKTLTFELTSNLAMRSMSTQLSWL